MRSRIASKCAVQLAALCLAFTISLALVGCGDGKIARYPVSGTVIIDGHPADGVQVVFCPVGGSEEMQRRYRPTGVTSPDGTFTLTTITKDDGAPAGEYKITAQWLGNTKDKFGRPALRDVDKLRNRYTDVQKSQIKATVNGPTHLPPFEFKTK